MKWQRWIEDWIVDNGSYKLVALFITIILWVSVLGRKEATVTKEVNVKVKLAEGFVISNDIPKRLTYRITGSRRSLRRLSQEDLPAVTIDLAQKGAGRAIIQVPEDSIKVPFGTKVLEVSPSSLVLEIERVEKKLLPIRILWRSLRPQDIGLRVMGIDPKEIEVQGATTVLKQVDSLWSNVVDLDQLMLEGTPSEVTFNTEVSVPSLVGIMEQPPKTVKVWLGESVTTGRPKHR